jgi:hypothetical protein
VCIGMSSMPPPQSIEDDVETPLMMKRESSVVL